MPRSAAIICTRNRAEALSRTVDSIENVAQETPLLLIVVDASDQEILKQNKNRLSESSSLSHLHLHYPDRPSLARQRNYGIQRLPSDVEIVFFLDDDVSLKPGYLREIVTLFDRNSEVVGVGGYDVNQNVTSSFSAQQLLRYLFLLDHPQPGRVLPSGEASPPHRTRSDRPISVHWLAGFTMAYRRSVLERESFDNRLDGYSHYEDRDLAVRICRHGRLMVHPGAQLAHRRSSQNRYDAVRFNYSMLTHLYWFVEKNLESPFRKPAFWWATLGRVLATVFSSNPKKWNALRGLANGIRTVLTRSHPLLKKN
jgi:GT2 family glycosyltransferase